MLTLQSVWVSKLLNHFPFPFLSTTFFPAAFHLIPFPLGPGPSQGSTCWALTSPSDQGEHEVNIVSQASLSSPQLSGLRIEWDPGSSEGSVQHWPGEPLATIVSLEIVSAQVSELQGGPQALRSHVTVHCCDPWCPLEGSGWVSRVWHRSPAV